MVDKMLSVRCQRNVEICIGSVRFHLWQPANDLLNDRSNGNVYSSHSVSSSWLNNMAIPKRGADN